MEFLEINSIPNTLTNEKTLKSHSKLQDLIQAIKKKEVSRDVIEKINLEIQSLNGFSGTPKEFLKSIAKSQTTILKLVEKEYKFVPIHHYRNLWLVLGMSAFGMPLGVAFGFMIGNLAFLGLGLPIGMGIGIAVGVSMDKKAADENRQLDFDLSS